MPKPKLEISTDYGMEELVETIVAQWDEDKIIQFMKEIDSEMGDAAFTKEVFDHFDELRKLDEVAINEEIALEEAQKGLQI